MSSEFSFAGWSRAALERYRLLLQKQIDAEVFRDLMLTKDEQRQLELFALAETGDEADAVLRPNVGSSKSGGSIHGE